MKLARLLPVAALCLGTSGCWFGQKAAPKVPTPPVAPQPVAAQPAPPPPAAPVPEPPPPSPEPVVQNVEPAPVPKETPPPRPVVRRNPAPAPPALPSPAAPAAAPAPTAPVAPRPQLQEIISGDRRRQYESEFSQGITRASAAVKQASTRALNASQQETAARIRTFLAQANAALDNDISTALQLARRADLLGQELLNSLK